MPEPKYDIDVETGLPVLPEDQRWYVGWTEANNFGIMIQVLHPQKTREVTKEVVAPKKHWWEAERTETVVDRVKVIPAYWSRGNFLTELDWDDLTPETIREAAQTSLERRDSWAMRNALLGTYPPKKLED
jgi:hypothetical protein